jgi:hypothetical protein
VPKMPMSASLGMRARRTPMAKVPRKNMAP